eukprot:161656-Chlamydomonas_euryale.AAC.9
MGALDEIRGKVNNSAPQPSFYLGENPDKVMISLHRTWYPIWFHAYIDPLHVRGGTTGSVRSRWIEVSSVAWNTNKELSHARLPAKRQNTKQTNGIK